MPNTADCRGDDTVRGLPCRGRVTGAPCPLASATRRRWLRRSVEASKRRSGSSATTRNPASVICDLRSRVSAVRMQGGRFGLPNPTQGNGHVVSPVVACRRPSTLSAVHSYWASHRQVRPSSRRPHSLPIVHTIANIVVQHNIRSSCRAGCSNIGRRSASGGSPLPSHDDVAETASGEGRVDEANRMIRGCLRRGGGNRGPYCSWGPCRPGVAEGEEPCTTEHGRPSYAVA